MMGFGVVLTVDLLTIVTLIWYLRFRLSKKRLYLPAGWKDVVVGEESVLRVLSGHLRDAISLFSTGMKGSLRCVVVTRKYLTSIWNGYGLRRSMELMAPVRISPEPM